MSCSPRDHSHSTGSIILQTSHQEHFVREAVIGISALAASKKPGNELGEDVLSHAGFAYEKYEKSLQLMRKRLSHSDPNPRMTLIACLLVCSFESIAGNHLNTAAHSKAGSKILRSWVNKYPQFEKVGIASPEPLIVEDIFVHAFLRLDRQLLCLFDTREHKIHLELMNEGTATVQKMPRTFYSMDEAYPYSVLIQTRIMHFLHSAATIQWKESNNMNVSMIPNDVIHSDLHAGIYANFLNHSQVQETLYEQHKRYMEDFRRWEYAFRPLYETLRQAGDAKTKMNAEICVAVFEAVKIILSTMLDTTAHTLEKYTPEFRLVIDLARPFIDGVDDRNKDFRLHFGFESGIIACIHLIAKYCRNRTLRRDAIAVLRKVDCEWEFWNSKALAAYDEQLMEIEENGVETEQIPDWAQVKIARISPQPCGNSCAIEFIRGQPYPPDDLQDILCLDPELRAKENIGAARETCRCLGRVEGREWCAHVRTMTMLP